MTKKSDDTLIIVGGLLTGAFLFREQISEAFQGIGGGVSRASEGLGTGIGETGEAVGLVVSEGAEIVETASDILQRGATGGANVLEEIFNLSVRAGETLGEFTKRTIETLKGSGAAEDIIIQQLPPQVQDPFFSNLSLAELLRRQGFDEDTISRTIRETEERTGITLTRDPAPTRVTSPTPTPIFDSGGSGGSSSQIEKTEPDGSTSRITTTINPDGGTTTRKERNI